MLVASLLILHLAFCGLVVALPVSYSIARAAPISPLSLLGVSLLAGILLNVVLVLLLQGLALSFVAGLILDLAGLLLLFLWRDRLNGELKAGHTPAQMQKTVIFVLCAALAGWLTYQSLLAPIDAWDARSIWFFAAKKIYYAGGLTSDIGKDMLFEHADYPKLIPVLAAQIAQLAGYWNEYLPLSIVAILLIVECLMLSMLFDSVLAMLLFFALSYWAIGLSPYLTNGYADMHLAIITTLACGFLLKAVEHRDRSNAVFGVLLLGMAASLKNEGLVLALIIGLLTLVVSLIHARQRGTRSWTELTGVALGKNRNLFAALALALLPMLLWKMRLWQWDISNDLTSATGWGQRFAGRMNTTDVGSILRAIQAGPLLILALLTWAVVAKLEPHRRIDSFMPIAASALYLGVLLLVYMTTPLDLAWHLDTSADRVAFPIKLMLIYGISRCASQVLQHLAKRWGWAVGV